MSNSVKEVVDCARKADDEEFFPLNAEMLRFSASKIARMLW